MVRRSHLPEIRETNPLHCFRGFFICISRTVSADAYLRTIGMSHNLSCTLFIRKVQIGAMRWVTSCFNWWQVMSKSSRSENSRFSVQIPSWFWYMPELPSRGNDLEELLQADSQELGWSNLKPFCSTILNSFQKEDLSLWKPGFFLKLHLQIFLPLMSSLCISRNQGTVCDSNAPINPVENSKSVGVRLDHAIQTASILFCFDFFAVVGLTYWCHQRRSIRF